MTALNDFKKVCHKHLVIHDDNYLDVVFGTILANRLDSKPVWLYLIGAPSSGKTEILQAIQSNDTIQVSRLGQHSLISFYEKKDSKGNIVQEDASLLPVLHNKTMIIKDFTAMINDRRETLMAVAGQLRDAYDGFTSRSAGTGYKSFTSKFGIIAGVTNVIDRHRGLLAELGERFLTYRCPEIDDCEASERCWQVSRRNSASKRESEIRQAAQAVLNIKLHKVILSDSLCRRIIETAKFVAASRCEITRNKNDKEPEMPMPEVATRLTRQLCDLATGIAVAREKRYVDAEIEKIVLKTAIDCLTLKRIKLLQVLYSNFPKFASAFEIAEKLKFSESSVNRWLEDLYLLDLVEKQILYDTTFLQKRRVFWRAKFYSVLKHVFS